jgi:opacity protein-like surface antigen
MIKKLSILLVSTLFAFHVQAEGLDGNKLYLGGGLGYNDIGYDEALGFQLFAGLPIPVKMGKARLLGEVGYMDSGKFEQNAGAAGTASAKARGIWANAVVDIPVGNKLSILARAGLDFGDDDGLMIGGGLGIPAGNKIDLRFEYVVRENIDSLQANLVIKL